MRDPEIRRGDVWWISLDPTQGSEIKKTRPCLVLTADVLNRLRKTVVVVPLSTASRAYPPITVAVACQGRQAVAVIDQLRAVSKHRLKSRAERASEEDLGAVAAAVREVLDL